MFGASAAKRSTLSLIQKGAQSALQQGVRHTGPEATRSGLGALRHLSGTPQVMSKVPFVETHAFRTALPGVVNVNLGDKKQFMPFAASASLRKPYSNVASSNNEKANNEKESTIAQVSDFDQLASTHPKLAEVYQKLNQECDLDQDDALANISAQMLNNLGSAQSLDAYRTLNNYLTLKEAEANPAIKSLLLMRLDFQQVATLAEYKDDLNGEEKKLFVQAYNALASTIARDVQNDLQVGNGSQEAILARHEVGLIKFYNDVEKGDVKFSDFIKDFHFEDVRVDKATAFRTSLEKAVLITALGGVAVASWNGGVYAEVDSLFESVFGVKLADNNWDGMEPLSAVLGSYIIALGSVRMLNVMPLLQGAARAGGMGTKVGDLTPPKSIMPATLPQNKVQEIHNKFRAGASKSDMK